MSNPDVRAFDGQLGSGVSGDPPAKRKKGHAMSGSSDFVTLAREQGMSIQVLSPTFLLVNYKDRWEVFHNLNMSMDDEDSGFASVIDMLQEAHQVADYSQEEGFAEYAREYGLGGNVEYAWFSWRFGWQYLSRFKVLLGKDFNLFVEAALAV